MDGTGRNHVLVAGGLVLLAMALIGYIDNFVRVIAEDGGLWQFHLLRSLMALPILGAAALLTGWRLRPLRPARVAARSLFNGGAMFLYFGCLALLPIGQVVAGLFTAPIFVLLISAFVYGEKVGPWRIGAVALGFFGIALILRLDRMEVTVLSLMPVLAGFFHAIASMATRRWCAGESALTLCTGFFVVMGIGGALGLGVLTVWPQGDAGFILRGWVTPTQPFLFWTFVQAVGSIVGVALIIRGYQLADASHVAVFENTLLVFAAVWAFLLWGEVPAATALAGMVAIGVAGGIIAVRGR